MHRDLKPTNFLVELKPYFKVVIADFGLANVTVDNDLLKTFCGSLDYMAPDVFPSLSEGHGPPADVWSLGVIGIDWIYTLPDLPQFPLSRGQMYQKLWDHWIIAWAIRLYRKLMDEGAGDDQLIYILRHMIEFAAKKRWTAKARLSRGLKAGLFKRRMLDGLVVRADHKEEEEVPEADSETPTQASPSLKELH